MLHPQRLCRMLNVSLAYLHLGEFGEISRGDLVLLFNPMVDVPQVGYQFLLLGVLTKHSRHVSFQRADNIGLYLDTKKEITQTYISIYMV